MRKLWLLFLTAAVAGAAQAQTWPAKPVRVVVNVAPGGVADITARLLAAKLQDSLAQPIVVENKPGGDGYIGFEPVVRAEPDGYTFVYAPGSTVMIAPHIVKRSDLNPARDLVPVAATGSVSLYVMAHPSAPFGDLKAFLAYARANPGKLNYGSPGNGTSPHIAVEVFNREAGVKLVHVPYKGAGPALKDLLGGVIHLAFDPGVGLNPARAGKLRMIAVAGPARHPDFPDVPTLQENGIRGVDGGPYFGFYAPQGLPGDIAARMNRAVQEAMQDAQVRDRFKALAVNVAEAMSPAEFAAYVKGEYERYGRLIPELGIGR